MLENAVQLFELEEALTRVPLLERRDVRSVEKLSSLHCKREHALEDGQLAIALGIGYADRRPALFWNGDRRPVRAGPGVSPFRHLRCRLPVRIL